MYLCECAYLPVLGLALKHQRVFRLVNVIWVLVFDLLDVGLSLNAVIFREGALMALLQFLSVKDSKTEA